MSSFFSIGGRRGGHGGDRSDSNKHPGGDGEDAPHVPPREISFWYDRADHHNTHGDGGFIEPCHQQQHLDLYSYSSSGMRRSTRSMEGADTSGMIMAGGYGGGGMCCQECGNGAKKECVHLRCRTCCQGRGFDCPTHVKSTWVPASKRRERQQQLHQQQQQQQQLQLSSSHQVLSKRRQLDDPASAGSTSLASVSHDRSGLEAGNFPAEVNSSATFRCVCLSSSDELEDHDQYAYQTAVNIGGHLFKGILYDQGPDHIGGDVAAGESSSGGGSGGVTQPLRLGGPAESRSAASATLIEPYASLYPSSFNFYNSAGMQFFPHPRS